MERAMNLFVILGLAAFLCLIESPERVCACGCQFIHPQDQFCRADFVVKAYVRRSKVVDLDLNGVVHYRRKNKERKNKDNGSGEEDNAVEDIRRIKKSGENEMLNRDEWIRPAPIVLPANLQKKPTHTGALNGPESRMPGYHTGIAELREGKHKAVYAPGFAPKEDQDISRQKRDAEIPSGKSNTGSRRRHGYIRYGEAPGRINGPVSNEGTTRSMIQYKIDVVQTFKGLDNLTKEARSYVYTNPPPLCSMKLETGRTPYILMGNMVHGSMVVTLCDYAVNMNEISRLEGKNLIRNVRDRFEDGCEDCEIKVCNRYGPCNPKPASPFQCVWEDTPGINTSRASQYACLVSKPGKCKWYNRLTKNSSRKTISTVSRR